MPWYDDINRSSNVATYRQERAMRAEMEAAAQQGFVAQGVARKGNEWTVTYHRDERARTRIQLQQKIDAFLLDRSALQAAENQVADNEAVVTALFNEARTATSNPMKLEQALLKSITTLATNRRALDLKRQSLLTSYASLPGWREQANKVDLVVPTFATLDADAESSKIRSRMEAEASRIQSTLALRPRQQAVIKALHVWQKLIGERWRTHAKVEKLDTKSAAQAAGAQSKPTIIDKLTAFLDGDRSQHAAKLESADRSLQAQEVVLLRELEARDQAMAALLATN